MFNPTDLLGGLLQGGGGAGMRGNPMGRLEHAMGSDRGLGGAGGPLGQILGQLGHTGGGASPGLGGMGGPSLGGGGGRPMGRDLAMGGLGTLAGAILGGRGGMGGGGMGGLGSVLGGALGGGRSMGGGMGGLGGGGGNMRGALGAGGLAVLGMLAMRALRNAGQQPAQQPTAAAQGGGGLGGLLGGMLGGQSAAGTAPARADEADPMPPDEAVSDRTAGLVLQAMIEAAKADGRVDATERQRIVAKAEETGASREALEYLQQRLSQPLDPDAFASQAAGDPVVAAQVYAASLLAIQVDTPQEQAYLRDLAGRLGLQHAVVAQLHGALGAPAPA